MTVKKSAGTKKTAARHATPDSATESAMPHDMAAPEPMAQDGAPKQVEAVKVWALPVAMLMLVVAAGGLWFAVRESSNTSQAATPAATEATLAPEPNATKAAAPAAPAAAMASKEAAKTGDVVEAKVVSVTGCLQQADRGFVLKDTEGTDAPKSRSWKSGFMRRSNASIALSDTKSPARLADHVGERVSVTGPMADRALRVTSMKRLSATCG